MLGGEGLVAAAPWPEADPALLVEASVTLPVQVNGKRRAEIAVPAGSDAATIEALVLQNAGGAAGAERRRAAAAGRRARPDRQCGGLSRRGRRALLAAVPALLAACGFTPLYGPGAPAAAMAGPRRGRRRSRARPASRCASELTGRLGPATAPTHRLDVDASTSTAAGVALTQQDVTTRYDVIGTADLHAGAARRRAAGRQRRGALDHRLQRARVRDRLGLRQPRRGPATPSGGSPSTSPTSIVQRLALSADRWT